MNGGNPAGCGLVATLLRWRILDKVNVNNGTLPPG
jgi:hypothetical protein